MQRLNAIIHSPTYQHYIEQNSLAERERMFCRHGFDHMLDVARIAYIYFLEHHLSERQPETAAETALAVKNELKSTGWSKELVYTAGILHDIGRWVEYQTGEDHAEVSARLARPLLAEHGFTTAETEMVLEAILHHRRKDWIAACGENAAENCVDSNAKESNVAESNAESSAPRNPLVKAIALADLWSRDCGFCQARAQCKKADLVANWSLKL